MFHNTRNFVTPLHIVAEQYGEALQSASLLLGGRPFLRRTVSLLDDLQRQPVITRQIAAGAIALHGLLTLQNVHDDTLDEAIYFADLDPGMSVVEEICILADLLGDALVSSGIPVRGTDTVACSETDRGLPS